MGRVPEFLASMMDSIPANISASLSLLSRRWFQSRLLGYFRLLTLLRTSSR